MFFFTSHKTREGSEMREDETKKLSDRQLLEQISRGLAPVEAFVDDRQRDTRPLLGEIQKEIAEFRAEFLEFKQEMRHELRMLREDLTIELCKEQLSYTLS
jgi:hypothetical protein